MRALSHVSNWTRGRTAIVIGPTAYFEILLSSFAKQMGSSIFAASVVLSSTRVSRTATSWRLMVASGSNFPAPMPDTYPAFAAASTNPNDHRDAGTSANPAARAVEAGAITMVQSARTSSTHMTLFMLHLALSTLTELNLIVPSRAFFPWCHVIDGLRGRWSLSVQKGRLTEQIQMHSSAAPAAQSTPDSTSNAWAPELQVRLQELSFLVCEEGQTVRGSYPHG